jgi:rubrerythrin
VELIMNSINGLFTHQEVEKLFLANKRERKHAKVHRKYYICSSCGFSMLYKTLRCPLCEKLINNVKV